jgi:hypothetical protein
VISDALARFHGGEEKAKAPSPDHHDYLMAKYA